MTGIEPSIPTQPAPPEPPSAHTGQSVTQSTESEETDRNGFYLAIVCNGLLASDPLAPQTTSSAQFSRLR